MRRFRPLLNNLCLALLALFIASPLAAQLNPAWQTSNSPDFLDLYQKSSSSKTKPEIVTVFDFSGSMQSLMYHPSYVNNETFDIANGDHTGITFKLTGGTGAMTVTAVVGPPSWGYSSTQLIRPDGSLVTETNVNTTATRHWSLGR